MLEALMAEVHNYFIEKLNPDSYTIANGVISPAVSLKEGQRFWIVGSSLNDGVYTWHDNGIKNDDDGTAATLQDEEFNGNVCALAVPKAVIALAKEIADWVGTYGAALASPYTSESVIGVYSYTKSKGGGTSGSEDITWQSKFKTRLNRWRKVSL